MAEKTFKPRVRRLSESRYLIESRSQRGLGRQVDVVTKRCSCPAGKNNRRCWHLTWALQYAAWRKQQSALLELATGAPQTLVEKAAAVLAAA